MKIFIFIWVTSHCLKDFSTKIIRSSLSNKKETFVVFKFVSCKIKIILKSILLIAQKRETFVLAKGVNLGVNNVIG
jgi:hypothetical protein